MLGRFTKVGALYYEEPLVLYASICVYMNMCFQLLQTLLTPLGIIIVVIEGAQFLEERGVVR